MSYTGIHDERWLRPLTNTTAMPSPPRFPPLTKNIEEQVGKAARHVEIFALKVCVDGLSLVEDLAPPAVAAQMSQIVRQYHRALLRPFIDWASTSSYPTDGETKGSIRQATKAIVAVEERVGHLHGEHESWTTRTVFDVVYSVLAWKFGVSSDMMSRMPPQVHTWLDAVKKHCPFVVTFDVDECLVGTSCAHWSRISWLQDWETGLRDLTFAPNVKEYLQHSQTKILLETEGSKSVALKVQQGRKAQELQLCHELCAAHRWFTFYGDSLSPAEACSMCQILYYTAAMTPTPAEATEKVLKRPWGCAESSVFNQLWKLWQAKLKRDKQT